MVMPGGCEKDYETCHCECHGDNQLQVKHCTPCCYLCLGCGKNIEKGSFTQHQKKCLICDCDCHKDNNSIEKCDIRCGCGKINMKKVSRLCANNPKVMDDYLRTLSKNKKDLFRKEYDKFLDEYLEILTTKTGEKEER